ncbi:FMN-linked oxidoreductase [Ophiobolus disseminans]|uniref:FMN-linked oxidoreductase n=1 Tax=Ophiobolus disseminans TaxID=1469910 RepID=A0A6A7AIR4_9PLEO|nr:FMN-linked oxidoreductase [Ophiobolus disseminans]
MELTLSKSIRLKCGLELPNRLVKAAMAECLGKASENNLPGNQECMAAYQKWAQGGWGLIITGNVQVDPAHLGDPYDFAVNSALPEATTLTAFTSWSNACSNNGKCHALVQLCHPGRQIAFGKETVAPSAIPLDFGSGFTPRMLNSFVFGTPRAMTIAEIHATIRNFANAARLMAAAGFAGVELHAAHGYLLAQFLSPRCNIRTDSYGGSARARARIVVEVICAVRAAVPPGFCVGLKLNSVDVGSVAGMDDCIEQIRAITEAGIDFLEISGGSFEDPTFNTGLGAQVNKASTVAREAFFIEFAQAVRAKFRDLPLMVTGGFRSRHGMEAALADNCCDLIGVARPAVMNPLLPRTLILNPDIRQHDAVQHVKRIPPGRAAKLLGIKLVGVGPERDWYTKQIKLLGSTPGDSSVTNRKRRVAQIISLTILVALVLWFKKLH